MQFGFMPGRGTTDAIFIVRQIQETYIRKSWNLFRFDRVPRKVLWWALRKVGIPEWIVHVIQVIYQSARSQVRVNNLFTDVFDVQVGVHQGSALSPLLFIIVLEALSREFCTSCPWELLYADDLVLIADTMDELLSKLGNWKKHLEANSLRVNMGKTKIMVSGKNLHSLRDSGKHPCGVCCKGVGSNSILCCGCQLWIHKKCSGIKGKFTADPSYKCKRCMGLCRPIDGRPENHVTLEGSKLDVVESFCYLGDELFPGGGCKLATIARSRAAWGKFCELLPLLASSTISLARRGMLFNSCIIGALLHVSECWALRMEDIQRLLRNERAMLCWMLRDKAEDDVSLHGMYSRLSLQPLESRLRINRLGWYGHLERSEGWIKHCNEIVVTGCQGRGSPRKSWKESMTDDLCLWNIDPNMVHDRPKWKNALKTAMKSPTHGNHGKVAQSG